MASKKRALYPSELHIEQRIIFFALALSDVTQAMEACVLALSLPTPMIPESPHYVALAEIAVIRYARPFCASRIVTPETKLNVLLDNGFVPTEPGAAELHAEIMARRSSIVAHSDMRNRNVVLKRQPDDGRWSTSVSCTFVMPENLRDLQRMAQTVSIRLHKELNTAAEERFGNVPAGKPIQIGGGNPAYIDALQAAWRNRQRDAT